MNIAVVGLGFVGLSISSVLASKNYNVVGIDIDNQKCSDIRNGCLLYTSPSPRDLSTSRMPSSA